MSRSKRYLIFALAWPILALVSLAAYKQYFLTRGREIVLPIEGYDPRDLLSGHYLIYRVNYGVGGICQQADSQRTAYVCLEPKMFSYVRPLNCTMLIRGNCRYGRFQAGIERFYIPENEAQRLDTLIRAKKASILLSLSSDGQTLVKDLLLDGQSWKESLP